MLSSHLYIRVFAQSVRADRRKSNGRILYVGPSSIDGAPIMVVATGFRSASSNEKTGGGLLQTFILRLRETPWDAVMSGADYSICGDCPSRRDPETGERTCYVTVFQSPRSVWQCAMHGAGYPMADASDWATLARSAVRKGSYGDPGATPRWVWDAMEGRREPGYTHQWQTRPDLMSCLMASVESPSQAREAHAMGWRTFRVRHPSEPLLPGETVCPASEEGGRKATCDTCGLCDGSRGPTDTRASVAIIAHGPTGAVPRFERMRARMLLPVIQ